MGIDSTWVIDITISTLEALSEMQYHYINLRLTLHCTHTQPFNGRLSGTTRVGRYQKKHSPTHTRPDQ